MSDRKDKASIRLYECKEVIIYTKMMMMCQNGYIKKVQKLLAVNDVHESEEKFARNFSSEWVWSVWSVVCQKKKLQTIY